MAHKVIILYRLYMPYYFLGTFTEYPYLLQNCTPNLATLDKYSFYNKPEPCLLIFIIGHKLYFELRMQKSTA